MRCRLGDVKANEQNQREPETQQMGHLIASKSWKIELTSNFNRNREYATKIGINDA